MKKLLTVLIVLVTLLVIELDNVVFIAPHVDQHLSELNTNYPLEITACLDYLELSNNLFIYDYNVPTVYRSSRSKVTSNKCAPDQARYHNHPYQDLQDSTLQYYYHRFTGDSLVEDHQMLYLSGTDIFYSVINKNEYTFVGVKGEYAWWTRAQVLKAFRNNKNILLIKNNQTTL